MEWLGLAQHNTPRRCWNWDLGPCGSDSMLLTTTPHYLQALALLYEAHGGQAACPRSWPSWDLSPARLQGPGASC